MHLGKESIKNNKKFLETGTVLSVLYSLFHLIPRILWGRYNTLPILWLGSGGLKCKVYATRAFTFAYQICDAATTQPYKFICIYTFIFTLQTFYILLECIFYFTSTCKQVNSFNVVFISQDEHIQFSYNVIWKQVKNSKSKRTKENWMC